MVDIILHKKLKLEQHEPLVKYASERKVLRKGGQFLLQ